MTQEERFAIVENLKHYMHEYRTTGSTKLNQNDSANLKAVYLDIFRTNINTSCPNCIKHYLNMLESWYEREHAIYMANQAPQITPTTEPIKVPEPPKTPVAPKTKKK